MQVDHDVPPPNRPRHGCRRYPFDAMEVGDSFFEPTARAVGPYIATWRKAHPEQCFTTEQRDGGTRCWRVDPAPFGIAVEHGVPQPKRRWQRRPYPFSDMREVGDSFLITRTTKAPRVLFARWVASHPDWRFRTAREGDGIRVWRVA